MKIQSSGLMILLSVVLGLGGIYLVFWLSKSSKNKTWAKVVNPSQIRNDSGGSGEYKSSRSSEAGIHQGVDLSVSVGQAVYAPINGTITRKANPYANDSRYSGLLLKGENGEEIKIFYCLSDKIGQTVQRGERIATTQAISKKYGSGVTDHIHVELRINGVLTDPTNYLI